MFPKLNYEEESRIREVKWKRGQPVHLFYVNHYADVVFMRLKEYTWRDWARCFDNDQVIMNKIVELESVEAAMPLCWPMNCKWKS